jgi:uncharacterized protein (DUF2461 family)
MSNEHVSEPFGEILERCKSQHQEHTPSLVATWRELVLWGIRDADEARDERFAREWSASHQSTILAERGAR